MVNSTSKHDVVAIKSPSSRSVRMTRMLAPTSVSFASTTTPVEIAVSATVNTAIEQLYDKYILRGIKIRFFWQDANRTYTSYGHQWAVCFDPTRDTDGTLTTPAAVAGYGNSRLFGLTPGDPIYEYQILNPTHEVIGSTGAVITNDPVETDQAWLAGYLYLAPFAASLGVTNSLTYSVELDIEYIDPRIKN